MKNIKAQYNRITLNKTNEKVEIFIGLLPMLIFVNFYLKSSYYQLFGLTNFLKSDIIIYV